MPDVVLAIIVFAPLAITYFLKSNAALSFIVLCVGFVLTTSVIGDLTHLLSQMNLSVTNDTIGLILLLLPLILTLLLTRRAVTHRSLTFFLQLVAALGVGGLLALSAGPLLAASSQFDITKSKYWNDLNQVQAIIIGIGATLSLLLIWFSNFRRHRH